MGFGLEQIERAMQQVPPQTAMALAGGGAAPPANEVGTWVRSQIHQDNLSSNYGKQASGARKLRDDFETKIIKQLQANNMTNAVIQVSGARLQCTEDKCTPSLSMPRLESQLHKYFQQKGNHLDETESILRFIKSQKAAETQALIKLKKIAAPVALPGPPPS